MMPRWTWLEVSVSEANGYVQRGMAFDTTHGTVVLTGPVNFSAANDRDDDGDEGPWHVTAHVLSAKGKPFYFGGQAYPTKDPAHMASATAAMRYARGEPCYPKNLFETVEARRAELKAEYDRKREAGEPNPEGDATPPTPQ